MYTNIHIDMSSKIGYVITHTPWTDDIETYFKGYYATIENLGEPNEKRTWGCEDWTNDINDAYVFPTLCEAKEHLKGSSKHKSPCVTIDLIGYNELLKSWFTIKSFTI